MNLIMNNKENKNNVSADALNTGTSFNKLLNNITLGDSYELIKQIPDNSIDLIIIDPPYEIETEGGNTEIGKSIKKNMIKELKQLHITDGIDYSLLDELCRIMKKTNIYIWCNKKQILSYLKYFVEVKNVVSNCYYG